MVPAGKGRVSLKIQVVATAILAIAVLHAPLVTGIPLEDFFPFGLAVGDTPLPKILDISSPPIQLNISSFPYFGQDHEILYVNANGDISFIEPVSNFVPLPFPLRLDNVSFIATTQVIAPFWADSDTEPPEGGDVWYRETNDLTLLQRARDMIRAAFINQASFQPLSLFIATWDHVGVYPGLTDRNNTFQCVLVTDGLRSFTVFLYADELIQWLWSEDHEGVPAQVGFNAGDGVRFFSHPDSMTERLFTIYETSNIGVPGVWLFRVDQEDIVTGGCVVEPNAQITLVPRVGNMLGGTGVLISGPCVNESDRFSCSFDNVPGDISLVSESLLLCVSPPLNRVGAVSLKLKLSKFRPGERRPYLSIESSATFYAVSPERAHTVDFEPTNLLLSQNEDYRVTWSPHLILPSTVVEDFSSFTVDVQLYRHQYRRVFGTDRYEWAKSTTLASNCTNNGEAVVKIPSTRIRCKYPKSNQFMFNVCPVAIKVSVSSNTPQQNGVTLSDEAGQWTGVAFLKSSRSSNSDMRKTCENWSNVEATAGTSVGLSRLIPCPPTLRLAEIDTDYEREELSSLFGNTRYSRSSMEFFHPNLFSCYRQTTPTDNGQGQQCCYDNDGNLVKGSPAGGSADSFSPKADFNMHLIEDLVPYAICCKSGEGTSNCGAYYQQRPSGGEGGYVLPVPACIYGDPHIVTLDGLKYTFNGKGEFTLIETDDNSFTLQGRMEPAKDAGGANALGTVFTAIIAIQETTNTEVQFELRPTGIRTIVDGLTVEFEDANEQNFVNVTVMDKGNSTVLTTFTSGVSIEIKADNGIISLMLVSLPSNLKGHTRGLMGNFNGIASDDLIRKSGTEPIPPSSSLEDIHSLFGMTWIITSEADSMFTYRPGDTWSEFYDPAFVPVFEPSFNDSALEEEAKSVCGEDKFCLFDIATTKRVEIGASTMNDSQSFNEIVELSEPIVCDPPCHNGACVENNTCRCNEGFVGDRCSTPVMSECEQSICMNNGTCVRHVATFTCMCPQGFTGAFCEEREPPFHIRLINSSPRVSGNTVLIDFVTSRPIASARCFLTGQPEQNCSSERIEYSGLPNGSYIFRVEAMNAGGERAVERRLIHISDQEKFCAVHLINEGVIVDGRNVYVQFNGDGPITSYNCILDKSPPEPCRSPVRYFGLEEGRHRIQVVPQGDCIPGEAKRLSAKFFIN